MVDRDDIVFRRHIRPAGWDYRRCFAYFVTICVRNRECVFGDVVGAEMRLTRRGIVARDCWLDIPSHHAHVELDAFVIMPNHVHGILLFVGDAPGMGPFLPVAATPASRRSLATASSAKGPAAGSLGAVIGSFKSAVTRTINRLRPGAGSQLWQPNYYDHIVRNDFARDRIREYVEANPQRWAQDVENPVGDGSDDVVTFVAELTKISPLRGERDAGVAATPEDQTHGEHDG